MASGCSAWADASDHDEDPDDWHAACLGEAAWPALDASRLPNKGRMPPWRTPSKQEKEEAKTAEAPKAEEKLEEATSAETPKAEEKAKEEAKPAGTRKAEEKPKEEAMPAEAHEAEEKLKGGGLEVAGAVAKSPVFGRYTAKDTGLPPLDHGMGCGYATTPVVLDQTPLL